MLTKRSLFYYWRTNLAVIAGVAIAVAVLAGALVVGDSVRESLRDLVLQRLGRTDKVVFSSGFFRENLAEELAVVAAALLIERAVELDLLQHTFVQQELAERFSFEGEGHRAG